MARLLLAAVGLLGTGLLCFAGCSGSSFTEGPGNAGSSNAGSAQGGTHSSGGSDNQGGSVGLGGTGLGGTGIGGTLAGGSDSGGTATGGSHSGGTGTAGSGGTSSAGTGTGGSTGGGSCLQDSDCVQCTYTGTPTQASDCCTNCNYKPMSKQECEKHKAVYDKFCANLHPICPAIACVQPPEALCKDGMCVSGSAP